MHLSKCFTVVAVTLLLVSCTVKKQVYNPVPNYLKDYQDEYVKDPHTAALHWFDDAKFGMFIHYGLYSQLGKGVWAQYNDTIPIDEYAKLKDSFTAKDFDADFVVKLAKKAGMKYITFTAVHHDGFCLFDTKETEFNSMKAPSKRDLVGELAKACDREGLGMFIYYSYAVNWRHPWFYDREDGWDAARPAYKERPAQYKYEKSEDFRHYIDYVHAQLTELMTKYPSIAGVWFDPITGYYENPDVFPIEETYALIRKLNPHALISFKHGANGDEDFMSSERKNSSKVQELSDRYKVAHDAIEKNKNKLKEVCNTMQPEAWGYEVKSNGKHLTVDQVKVMLGDALLFDYNLLLNIGPLPDGGVHPEDIETLSHLKD